MHRRRHSATAETIKGIQDVGVIACAKHFVANEQEHFRGGSLSEAYSSNLDDRTLHEVYVRRALFTPSSSAC